MDETLQRGLLLAWFLLIAISIAFVFRPIKFKHERTIGALGITSSFLVMMWLAWLGNETMFVEALVSYMLKGLLLGIITAPVVFLVSFLVNKKWRK